jgi:hypothetical protein
MGATSVTGTGHGSAEGPLRGDMNQVIKIVQNNGRKPFAYYDGQKIRESENVVPAHTHDLWHDYIVAFSGMWMSSDEKEEKPPTWTQCTNGLYLPFFPQRDMRQLFFSVQLPREYALGTNLNPYVNFVISDTAETDTITWGLEYSIASLNGLMSESTTIYGSFLFGGSGKPIDKYKYIRADFTEIDGKLLTTIGSIFACRIFRSPEDKVDKIAGLVNFGMHYQRDGLGTLTF